MLDIKKKNNAEVPDINYCYLVPQDKQSQIYKLLQIVFTQTVRGHRS